jgi:predicted TIM-barrel enzyme
MMRALAFCGAVENKPRKKLAIASGITPDNVEIFAPHADCFLVATGISLDSRMLDPAKVASVAEVLQRIKPES